MRVFRRSIKNISFHVFFFLFFNPSLFQGSQRKKCMTFGRDDPNPIVMITGRDDPLDIVIKS